MKYSTYLALIVALMIGSASNAMAEDPKVTYDQVRAVFKKHCVSCHGQERARGGLNLSTTAGIEAGASSGVVAVAGKPDESLLYTLTAHLEAPKMPPGAPKIPQRELILIRQWIEAGMPERTGGGGAPEVEDKSKAKPAALIEAVTSLNRPTAITALAFSPKESLLAVSGQGQVVLYSQSEHTPTKALPFPEGEVHALRFSANGDWLLAGGGRGGESGKVVGFDVVTGRRLFEIGDESDVVLTFDLSPDHSLVALGGPGKNVKIYRTKNGEHVTTLQKHTDWILSLAFSPDGLLLASSDRFGGLQIWDANTGKAFQTLRGHAGPVTALAWSRDSDRLLSAGQDGTLRLWDLHQGSQLLQWDAQVGGVLAAAWTAKDQIVTSGRDHKIAIFDLAGKRQQEWPVTEDVVEIAISADGNRLISGDAVGSLTTWAISTGARDGEFVLPVAPLQLVPAMAVAARKQRSKPITATSADSTANSLANANANAAATAELAVTLEALANTEAAVKSAEESLEKLRASAKQLKHLAAIREAAVKQKAKP